MDAAAEGRRLVEAGIVRRPLALLRPLGGARGAVTTRAVRLVHLGADDGIAGIGESSVVDWLGDAPPPNLAPLFRSLVERVRWDHPPESSLLRWTQDSTLPAVVRSGVQTALVDLEARRRGLPLAMLLGATQMPPAVPVSALLGDDEPEAMAAEARRLSADGVASFKLKVGRARLEDDLVRVAAVREAVGSDAALRVDANRAWQAATAREALGEMARLGVTLVEEPVADTDDLPSLRSPVPVALDESLRDVADLDRLAPRGGVDVVVLKLERTGGPLAALAMAERAARHGLDAVFTDSIESAVGRAAVLHVAVAAAARTGRALAPAGLGGLFLLDEHADPPRHGRVRVQGPGLGVDIEAILAGRPF